MLVRWPARGRWAAYGAALVLASASEALVVALFGGGRIIVGALRAILAGLFLTGMLDLASSGARWAEPRFGRLLGALIGIGMLLVPGPLALFEHIALMPEPPSAIAPRPPVSILSSLPLLWAEDGPLDARALRPNAAMRRLSAEFTLGPIDAATARTLAAAPVLFAAQPREMTAAEIEAIDTWVRMGGRTLLLADADLRWPSALPPGDARRPPRWATLAPLLARWGITVARNGAAIGTIDIATRGGRRRIVAEAAGVIRPGPGCRSWAGGRAAWCRIGRGEAIVLGDADMLDDRLWVGMGESGDSRLRRGGDNALLIAEWLDRLSGVARDRASDSVFWRRAAAPAWVFVGALLPALLIGLLAGLDIRRKAHFGRKAPHMLIHRNKAGSAADLRDYRGEPPPH